MGYFLGRLAAVAVVTLVTIQVAVAGVVLLGADGADKKTAESILAELEFFAERIGGFSHGALTPLFHGRSMPLPGESCADNHTPRIFGLLIGADDPGEPRMRLRGPANDVQLLSTTLRNIGAAPEDIFTLTGTKASREDIVESAWTILSRLECGDKVFVHFAGTALTTEMVVRRSGGDGTESPQGRPLDEVLQAARSFLSGGRTADVSALRNLTETIHWYIDTGIMLLLNGDGTLVDGELRSFEVFSGDDVAEMVTLFRNHRADVTLILDTCYASNASVLQRRIETKNSLWTADVVKTGLVPRVAAGSDARQTHLIQNPGDLAVFYSSIDEFPSIEASFDVAGEEVHYGLFTFRLAEALLNSREASVRDIADSLGRIVAADTERREQTHRIEATNEDMRIFTGSDRGSQRTDTIRIISPSGMRGATAVDVPRLEIVGKLDWHAPARAVFVEGQPASLSRDGRFSATISLKSGVNTVSVTGLTADNEIHLMPPLEFVYGGDISKLEGEGRRFALIVANRNYLPETRFASLQTPVADAEALRAILTTHYGFETEVGFENGDTFPLFLVDATKEQIEDALYTLGQVAGEDDTVLIYYAGHGVLDERTANAAWVPVDATRPYNYLSGATITEHVQRMMARKVILISDSCYSGALRSGGESDQSPLAQVSDEDRSRALMRMAEQKSRMLITSGSNEPVLDQGGGGHSVFARALLTGLENIDKEAFSAEELFREYIHPMVAGRADQTPQIRPIERTEHTPGSDVVFVRMSAQTGNGVLQ